MARPRIAVATCAALPDLDRDGPALLAALDSAGADTIVGVWDDPTVEWSAYDLVLVRNTWDYTGRRDEFLEWTRHCPRTTNPAPVLRWNTDKRYLADLQRRGLPVVPTAFLDPGEPFTVPAAWLGGEIVVKPTVSAGARDTGRFEAGDPAAAELAATLHAAGRGVMVQPYLTRVDSRGETALVYLGGEFSHAARKAPLLTGPGTRPPLVGDAALAAITAATPDADQLAVAAAALDAVPGGPGQLTYARVDLIPDADGRPVVLELELTEPALFLGHAEPAGVKRLGVAAVAAARAAAQ